MKKKVLAAALALCMVAGLAACGKSSGSTDSTATEGEITLGQYKGIDVKESTYTITEEELQDYRDSVCKYCSYTEDVTEGTLTEGLTVSVNYTAYVGGEEYTSAEATDITLEDDGFEVDGVVEALIGAEVGSTIEVTSTFDEDYTDADVAGKEVTFSIEILSYETTVIPEYTDEFVAENFAYLGFTTTAELDEYLERDLFVSSVIEEIWDTVVDNATVVSYDSEDLAELVTEYSEYQEYIIYYSTGYTLEEYLEAVGMTEDEFTAEMEASAKEELKERMVVEAIAEAEGIEISDTEYDELMEEYAGNYGYDSVEAFSSYYSSLTEEDFLFSMINQKVQEFVADNSNPVADEELETETETEDATEAETDSEDETEEDTTTAE